MLLVIMTRSLIRLDSIVRARTETDRDEIVITKSYKSITRSYRRERKRVGTNTNNDDITRGYN